MKRALPWVFLVGCAPPPAVPLTGDTAAGAGPSIEILYPYDGDTFELVGCALVDVPLVVLVEGVELVPPGEDVEGQGHWHGGPDLNEGYCVGTRPFCEGAPDRVVDSTYESTVDGPGTRKLQVELVNGLHQPFDGANDSVEITLLDSAGDCP
jgi:hypothetical protein